MGQNTETAYERSKKILSAYINSEGDKDMIDFYAEEISSLRDKVAKADIQTQAALDGQAELRRRAEAAEKRAAALEAALRNRHSLGCSSYSSAFPAACDCGTAEAIEDHGGALADDRDKQIIEALKALVTETCEHLEALVKVTREGMREPAKERK